MKNQPECDSNKLKPIEGRYREGCSDMILVAALLLVTARLAFLKKRKSYQMVLGRMTLRSLIAQALEGR
jgi:hypothetical protein